MKPVKMGYNKGAKYSNIKQKLSSSQTSGILREIQRPNKVKTKQREPNSSKYPSINKTKQLHTKDDNGMSRELNS